MSTANLGSLLIGSSQADVMKDWYRACFSPEETEMGSFAFGGCQVFIEEHSEVSGAAENPHRIILNLDVTGCRDLEAHLQSQGVTWERPIAASTILAGPLEARAVGPGDAQPPAAAPLRALNSSIMASHSGAMAWSRSQNAASRRASKSSSDTPCCSTHVK